MSKSSQESSPITQWRKKVIDAAHKVYSKGYGDAAAKFVPADPNSWWTEEQATEAITSATIELIQNAQHDDAKTCSCSLASYLLFDLRQSLKELKGE